MCEQCKAKDIRIRQLEGLLARMSEHADAVRRQINERVVQFPHVSRDEAGHVLQFVPKSRRKAALLNLKFGAKE